MKYLLFLAFFCGCISEPQQTAPVGMNYFGTGVLRSGSFSSPVRNTMLSVKDSTGTLVMYDENGAFTDVLLNVSLHKKDDTTFIECFVKGAEQWQGFVSLKDVKGVVNDSFTLGTTSRIIHLRRE